MGLTVRRASNGSLVAGARLGDQNVVAGIAVDRDKEPYSGGLIGEVFAQLRASPPRQTPFALVDDERVVDFIVAREGAALPDWAEKGCMTLNNLRIDTRLEGRGYGKAAIRLTAQWIARERPIVTQGHVAFRCGSPVTGYEAAIL